MRKEQSKITIKKKEIKKTKISQTLRSSVLKNQRVGLAISGGVDSMVMLDVFRRLVRENNIKLYALYFNHKWREKAHLDATLVKKYCVQNNIEFVYGETNRKIIRKDEGSAREERYSFFRNCAEKYGLKIICTAHHKDDQIETILFRLARGTGPKGLLPIKESYVLSPTVKIWRPFLHVSKKDIQDYASCNKILYVNDTTNKDLKYKRNLLRLKVMPLLKEINKEAPNNILSCANLIYLQSSVLGKYFCLVLKRLSIKSPFLWNRVRFLKLDESTRKAFLYWFLELYCAKGVLSNIEVVNNAILNLLKIDLSKEFNLIVTESKVKFERKLKGQKKADLNVDFSLNGVKRNICLRNKLFFTLKPFRPQLFDKVFPQDKQQTAYVDLSAYSGRKLTIRYRKPTDSFHPLGFSHTVKLKKYLINKKIPKERRYNLPLLCAGNEVLWIPGYSLSEKLKVLDKPTHVLKIRKK